MMFIWACGPIENFPNDEMLLGQVNIKMNALNEENGTKYLLEDFKIILSNQDVGKGLLKIIYSNE